MEKVLVSLSGGMDSATLLGDVINMPEVKKVGCVSFVYGSKHNKYEMEAAVNLIEYFEARTISSFKIEHYIIDVRPLFGSFKSNLLKSGGDIPEGHYTAPSMSQTVIPGRNLIFASICAGLAESNGYNTIALGVHSGDHAIYPDCRVGFIDSLEDVLDESTEGKVDVYAPYLRSTKEDLLKLGNGFNIPVPYDLTRTCYKDQAISCGKCGSCVERLEAFKSIGISDPIQYE